MRRMGRPRDTGTRDLPLGVELKRGRYYVRPVNEEMRRVFAAKFPDKRTAPLGADKLEMRKAWVALFVTADQPSEAKPGTVAELIDRFERDVFPKLSEKEQGNAKSYLRNLQAAFGERRYARTENEAGLSADKFLRTMHVQRYLDAEGSREVTHNGAVKQGRPVAVNREIRLFRKIFIFAKRWGYVEYNPVNDIAFHDEAPRAIYIDDDAFMHVYQKATPTLQCMMDLAQMHGARRGMLIKATLACITDDGLLLPLNKKKKTHPQRYQLIRWNDELRAVIDRWLVIRARIRGAQSTVMDSPDAPLFLTRKGKRYTPNSFGPMWTRARHRAGVEAHAFHFHDIKAKAVSDSPDDIDAMNRGGHMDLRTTKRVYRRLPTQIIPLPQVSKKKPAA
jgi:integrase